MRFSVKAENRGVVVTEASSYLRLTDSCITQFKAHIISGTCNESEEEEKTEGELQHLLEHAVVEGLRRRGLVAPVQPLRLRRHLLPLDGCSRTVKRFL